jgi:hypothetical protein
MLRLLALALSVLCAAGCSPSTAPSLGASAASTQSPPPASLAGASSASSATDHRLFDCHPTGGANACPMSPGLYVAEIHDRFSLEIKDTGWQEANTLPETVQDVEPMLLLTRIDDPNQRLMIDTGPTPPNVDERDLIPNLTGIQVSSPTAVNVGGTTGLQVDLAPSVSMELSVPVIPDTGYQLEPGNTYRLIVTQLPMGEESGIKLILISAPTASWNTFLPIADQVVQSLRFG